LDDFLKIAAYLELAVVVFKLLKPQQ